MKILQEGTKFVIKVNDRPLEENLTSNIAG